MTNGGGLGLTRRALDALAETGSLDRRVLDDLGHQVAHLIAAAGVSATPTEPPDGSDPLTMVRSSLDHARQAAATMQAIQVQLPSLEAAAAEEGRRGLGLWVMLGLVAVIVVAILIGQVL